MSNDVESLPEHVTQNIDLSALDELLAQPIVETRADVKVMFDAVVERIDLMEDALKNLQPNFPMILRDIHNKLKDQPELVHMLSDEQIYKIIAGLEKHTGIEVKQAAAKSEKTKENKRLKSVSADDI